MDLICQTSDLQPAGKQGQARGYRRSHCRLLAPLALFLWVFILDPLEAAAEVKRLGVNDELPRLSVYIVSPPLPGKGLCCGSSIKVKYIEWQQLRAFPCDHLHCIFVLLQEVMSSFLSLQTVFFYVCATAFNSNAFPQNLEHESGTLERSRL
jgi:hypothetical protein